MSVHAKWCWIIGLFMCLVARPAASSAQAVDPALKAGVERLLALDDVTAAANQLSRPFVEQMAAGLRRVQPTATDAQVAVMREVLVAELGKALAPSGAIREAFVTIYANHFTLADIEQIYEFYQTDTGKKLRAFAPTFQQQAGRAVQEWVVASAPQISAAVRERFKAEGFPPLP